MELIDKEKVIAELKRRVEAIRMAFNESGILSGVDRTYANAQHDAFKSLLPFLDTLEVKKVDLEKEFDEYTKSITAQDMKDEPFTQLFACAKHFFELGIKAKKGG